MSVKMHRDAETFPESHHALVEAEHVGEWEERGWTVQVDPPPAESQPRRKKAAE